MKNFTADNILSITQPEDLFPQDNIKNYFRTLIKKWHPDICKDKNADIVTLHITKLYEQALYKLSNDCWKFKNIYYFVTITGQKFKIKYQYRFFYSKVCECFVTNTNIFYFFPKEYKEFYEKYKENVRFMYSSKRMEKQISKYLPRLQNTYETDTHYILRITKDVDVIPLRLFLLYFENGIPPKHVAWIMSGIYNICCFLNYSKKVHNALLIDNIFISFEKHTVLLLGGWEYSTINDARLKFMPRAIYELNNTIIIDNCTSYKIDLNSVKAIGRELLGDKFGTMLFRKENIPRIFVDWFMLPGSDNAFEEYDKWMKSILREAFGKRRFIKLDIRIADIYKSQK